MTLRARWLHEIKQWVYMNYNFIKLKLIKLFYFFYIANDVALVYGWMASIGMLVFQAIGITIAATLHSSSGEKLVIISRYLFKLFTSIAIICKNLLSKIHYL